MFYFLHDILEFLGFSQFQSNPYIHSQVENGSELTDVDKLVCREISYDDMNRKKEIPCYEFISSDAGLKRDSTREHDEYYEGELGYRVWRINNHRLFL